MPKPEGDSRHVTLTANAVTTITLDADYDNVEVLNVDGGGVVYFTANGATPTVAGNGTVVLPAAVGAVTLTPYGPDLATIKLISAGTPKVSVRGW